MAGSPAIFSLVYSCVYWFFRQDPEHTARHLTSQSGHRVTDMPGNDEMEEYDLAGTIEWIQGLGLQRVALQLPDDRLHKAAWLVKSLSSMHASTRFYVLADTSVSSWDPDVVAAQHVLADGLVVYGRASTAKTDAMPIRHVFGQRVLDADALLSALREKELGSSHNVVVLPAGCYVHSVKELRAKLRGELPLCFVAELRAENASASPSQGIITPSKIDGGTRRCSHSADNNDINASACCGASSSSTTTQCCGESRSGPCTPHANIPSHSDAQTTQSHGEEKKNQESAHRNPFGLRLGNFCLEECDWLTDSLEKSETGGVGKCSIVYVGQEGEELTRLG
jgi:hypothetical protein